MGVFSRKADTKYDWTGKYVFTTYETAVVANGVFSSRTGLNSIISISRIDGPVQNAYKIVITSPTGRVINGIALAFRDCRNHYLESSQEPNTLQGFGTGMWVAKEIDRDKHVQRADALLRYTQLNGLVANVASGTIERNS